MRSARVLLAVVTLVTISMGQWLGERLSLLDTLRTPAGYQSLAYNRRNHTVYLSGSGSDSILVIDADRCRATEWIFVGTGVWALCYNPTEDKLYCAYADVDTVAVLDGTSHQMLARVGVDSGPCVLCLDSIRNKLYVGNRVGASVSVIDCRVDSVVGTIDCRRSGISGPSMMCLASSASRVYYATWRDSCILAIDCSADTVVAVVEVGQWPRAMCFSPVSNRLYCACWGDSESMVYGIDVETDSVVCSFDVRGPVPLCCDPAGERLFVPDFDTLFVVDCSTDTLIAKVNVREDDVKSFVGYSAVDDRVYVVGLGSGWGASGQVAVVDGEEYEVLRRFNGFYEPSAMCITDARARVLVAGGGESYVAAFDGKSDWRVGMWTNWSYTMAIHADAAADKLYCLSYPSQVIVVDPATNRRVAGIAVADYPEAVCFNPVDRKVYVASAGEGSGALQVLDGIGDSLLAEIDVPVTPTLLAFNPHDDILYAADPGSYWIWAISGKTDSVVGYDMVSERPVGLVYNEAQGKLYSFGREGTVTVTKPDLSGEICRIPVAEGLDLFALSSAGRYLYCGNRDLNLVYVIDCVQDRLAGVVPVEVPLASLFCPSYENMLYCGSLTDQLSVIDCAKNGLVGIAPVSADLVYADSATDAIYCLTGDDLAVVDGETRTVMRTFDLGSYASDLASSSNWQYVYAADERGPYLLAVHKASGPAEMAVRATPDAQATVVRGRLDWTGTLAVMYDKSGRRVADVHRGGNDVSRLQPGVYFVRQNGVRSGTYARKVVITS